MKKIHISLIFLLLCAAAGAQQNITAKSLKFSPKPAYSPYPDDSSVLFINRTSGKVFRTHIAAGMGTNFYNSNGTITSTRTVSAAGFQIFIDSASYYRVYSNTGVLGGSNFRSNFYVTPATTRMSTDNVGGLSFGHYVGTSASGSHVTTYVNGTNKRFYAETDTNSASISYKDLLNTKIREIRVDATGSYITNLPTGNGVYDIRIGSDGLLYKKDTVTGGGSGASPAGNYGNLQVNRNNLFSTPGNDSLSFTSSRLNVKGSYYSSTLTNRRILFNSDGTIKDTSLLSYNANGELLINSSSDEGDYKTQITGNAFFRPASGSTGLIEMYSGTGVYHKIQYDNSGQAFFYGASTTLFGTTAHGAAFQSYNQKTFFSPGGGTDNALVAIGGSTTARGSLRILPGTPATTLEQGLINHTNGLLLFDSSNLKRDTLATRAWVRNNQTAGAGSTDLSIGTRTATDLPLNSSTGADVNLPLATNTLAGIMSAADKARLDSNQYIKPGEGIDTVWVDESTLMIKMKYDTVAIASFGAGGGQSGDTSAFSTSTIYGSFFHDGSDTLIITKLKIGLQGTSPSVTADVFWNDSLNVSAGATKLVTAGTAATNIYEGTTVTSFNNTKIPPGNWVWVKTSSVTTKPTYLTLSLIGYKKRVNP